jgi:glycosyltransferase involved in cell wall biosynthesis
MTVFINGRFATQPQSGVQRYAGEIVRALDVLAGDGRWPQMVLLSPPGAPAAGLAHIAQRRIGRGGGHGWDQWAFARGARDGIALSLAMSGPLLHSRQLVVLHDAAVHRFPAHFSRSYGLGHRMLERGLARRARIATVSEFSRRELAAVLGISLADIVLAPNGADHLRGPVDDGVLLRLGLGARPFFLTVGNLSANKNLGLVMRALRRIAGDNVRLVIVGERRGRIFGPTQIGDDPRAIFAGRLSDAEVGALLRSARALIFPSRYEGCGLPPLEAMAAGCPVLASDCGAAIEVCGGAAEHFGPDEEDRLAVLMAAALADDGRWRSARIAAGFDRALHYRWASSATVLAGACAAMDQPRAVAA